VDTNVVELQYIQRKNNILFKLVFVFTFPKTKDKITLRPNDFPVFLVEIIEKNEVLRKPLFLSKLAFPPIFFATIARRKKKLSQKKNEDVPKEVKTDQHLTTSKRKKRFKSYDLQIIRFPSSNYKKSIRIIILCLEL